MFTRALLLSPKAGQYSMPSPKEQSSTFPCNQCGLCCQHVHLAEETRFLDRGDGICRHYDTTTRNCSIYAERPDICRVGRQYLLRYAEQYTWNEFVELNLQACEFLQAQQQQVAPPSERLGSDVLSGSDQKNTSTSTAKRSASTLIVRTLN